MAQKIIVLTGSESERKDALEKALITCELKNQNTKAMLLRNALKTIQIKEAVRKAIRTEMKK